MRVTFGVLLTISLVGLLAFVAAQMSVPDEGIQETPGPTGSESPRVTGTPMPARPQDGYFRTSDGRVSPTETMDYDWQRVEIRATITGVHFNINQQARSYDSSADNWTRVFTLNAPFQDTDYVSFCGPESTITIQVRDTVGDKPTFHEGSITEVQPCTHPE